MGYRIRLGSFPKEKYPHYENETYKNICSYLEEQSKIDKCSYSTYYPKYHTQLYEIGKYVDFKEGREPFYKQFDIYKEAECEFDILTKQGLKCIIQSYHDDIKEDFNKLFRCFEISNKEEERVIKIKEELDEDYEKPINNIFNHLYSKKQQWDESCRFTLPYRLDETGQVDGNIVSSWKIEYVIFELVYIYRTFDFENNFLIYSGW